MATRPEFDRRRLLVAALVLLLHAGIIALLLRPMLIPVPQPPEGLIVVDLPLPAPPAPEAEKPGMPQPEAAAAAAAPRAKPRPTASPAPVTEPAPSPVAPAASTGQQSASGAAAQGPGSGAQGAGFGAGAGASGAGQGNGGGTTRPRWVSGQIDRRDYPADANRAGATGSVTAHFDVGADGRVSGCVVARSSGNAALDRATCRLIEQRFRYQPARNPAGDAVPSVAGWRQDWWLEPPR
jgi:periplasmic protein TonB